MGRIRSLWLLLGLALFAVSIYDVSADVTPSENECRPYIEKAIHELKNTESTATDNESTEETTNTGEDTSIETTAAADEQEGDGGASVEGEKTAEESQEGGDEEEAPAAAATAEEEGSDDQDSTVEEDAESQEEPAAESLEVPAAESLEADNDTKEEEEGVAATETQEDTTDDGNDSKEGAADDEKASVEEAEQQQTEDDGDDSQEGENDEQQEGEAEDNQESAETTADEKEDESTEGAAADDDDKSDSQEEVNAEEANDTAEDAADDVEESVEEEKVRAKRSISEEATPEDNSQEADDDNAAENSQENAEDAEKSGEEADTTAENDNDDGESQEQADDGEKSAEIAEDANDSQEADDIADDKSQEDTETEGAAADEDDGDSLEADAEAENDTQEDTADEETEIEGAADEEGEKSEESMPEEDLTLEFEIPKNLRSRDHISDLLGLDAKSSIKENALKRTGDVVLKELKRVYDNAIKPLEQLYKYRDLSNRHFGDPEIFSKPLVLFMGPWSGGKSTILNYLTDNEYTANSIRSGAEPSPAYFNILMHGDEPEVLDGTQLAADWTFSGLQKFGQGLNDRLRGQKLPSKLLERVNIVEIPGILEVRKQVSRYFPFNDACQWFIDRADIIFLVYDPSKLDVGPETEAILDQLKGREYQTRIVLNKGDQVKPEELMRVQSALIWNISPLMSSAQPPVMYTVSLWSHPFEQGAPVRLLQAQERALLTDLREAIDKRIENKIASARRFAVRIRNHAKMVDCYLTTYYNQKSLFSNKKKVSDNIIEHPQNFNIYEGLSTLTNISRYDLPDPEVYLDFFRLNPLYEFKQLSETCTYFKGCPINKLDIAIAYDLPELVGKYKKLMEENYATLLKEFDDNCNQTEPEPPVKLR